MKYILILTFIIYSIFLSACGFDELIPESGSPDPEITVNEAAAQDYNFRTPLYEMQVAIRDDVNGNPDNILDRLDVMASNFLDCQFDLGQEIGFQDFTIENGQTIFPLSELLVFVVPFTFECDTVDVDICAGLYSFELDLMIISKESIGECSEFALLKHEFGHRYGMEGDHSNKSEFEFCIAPPDCIDLPFGIGD